MKKFATFTFVVKVSKDMFNLQSKTSKGFLTSFSNMQLMHSFEISIRICQPENSDVHRGEAQ